MKSQIDHKNIDITQLNALLKNTFSAHLGMEVTEVGADYLMMRMPVDHRTMQPFGTLDGGASVALAESAASLGAQLIVEKGKYCFGLEVNANHLKVVRSGYVTATAKPVHIGSSTQVWEIKIVNDEQQLVCIARMTMAVMDAPKTS